MENKKYNNVNFSETIDLDNVEMSIPLEKLKGTMIELPKQEGFIQPFEGLLVGVQKKPMLLHRWFMELFLGWKWKENINEK